ncbi:MAG: ATP-binding protein [Candidatus Competibacteraceae bacterium]|nr:ATP-binding protein [Candidatus Competibacteraceae bacterium]
MLTRSRRPPRPIPRHRLLRDLLLLVALIIGVLLAAVFGAGESLRDELAQQQLKDLAHKTSQDFAGFFRLPENSLRIAQGWGKGGDLDVQDAAALVSRFIPVLVNLAHRAALLLADSDGRSFYLFREGDVWLSRNVESQGEAVWRHWDGTGTSLLKERRESVDYDPRTRAWFKGALDSADLESIFWTRPYLFFTQQIPGVTGALHFQHPAEPDRDYVLALDFPLQDIMRALSEIDVGERGTAFLAEANGSVLLPLAAVDPADPALPVSLSAQHFDAGPVFEAVEAWTQAGRPAQQPLEFHTDSAWWTWLQPIGDPDRGLWLGIAIPEMDFLGALHSGWDQVLIVGVVVLVVGFLLVALLSRYYGRQFRALPSLTDDPAAFEDKVLALIGYGEGPTLEFKSTVRTNLKTDKPGKEIELAWLKGIVGFLNTDGGVLLIGVNDDGVVIGIEADRFENDDKCLLHVKNLINQHLGAEFSKYLHTDVRPVAGKTLVAMTCKKAAEPAFLLMGQNEEFYIRSGPSSIKLTSRQMLNYLRVR